MKEPSEAEGFSANESLNNLSAADVLCLQTLGALHTFELNCFAFVQYTITVFLDDGVMYEHIFTRAALDEAISLCAIEPLDCALFLHDRPLFSPAIETVFIRMCGRRRPRTAAINVNPDSSTPFIFRGCPLKGRKEAGIRTRRYVAADCTSTYFLRTSLRSPDAMSDASREANQPATSIFIVGSPAKQAKIAALQNFHRIRRKSGKNRRARRNEWTSDRGNNA